MNNKYKGIFILSCGLSIVALVVAVVALCRTCPRTVSLSFDYLGVIIGVLSVLVTVLIGWNIYSILDIESFKSQINDKIKEAQKEPNAKVYKSLAVIYNSLAKSYKINVLRQYGIKKIKMDDYEVYCYLQYSLYSIKYFCKIPQYEDDPLPDYPDKLIVGITAMINVTLKKRNDFKLPKKDKSHIEKLCSEISSISSQMRENKSFEELTEKIKSIPTDQQ